MKLKIFTQSACPNCPPAKKLGRQLEKETPELKVEWFDTGEVEGMAEGAFYQVMGTPTLILIDDQDKLVKDWRSEVPDLKELVKAAGL